MKLNWNTMENAPKDRMILLFGTDEHGNEMTAFAKWETAVEYKWERVTWADDERHERRVKEEYGYWDTGRDEIFPVLWADVENPMPRSRLTAGR